MQRPRIHDTTTPVSFPLLLLFGVGYVISRVFVRVDAHVALLSWIAQRSRGSATRLCLGIMLVTFGLSLCISNLLTVVAIIPLVQRAVDAMELEEEARRRVITFLALGVMYAANIGGMGSLIGSPSNGILLGALSLNAVPGRDAITFWTWLAFGLPMASVLLLAAWALLASTLGRGMQAIFRPFQLPSVEHPRDHRRGLWVCGVAVIGSIVVALANATLLPDRGAPPSQESMLDWVTPQNVVDWVTLVATLALVGGLFALPLSDRKERLLRWRDCWAGLPLRGVAIAVLATAVGSLMYWMGALDALQRWMTELLPTTWSHTLLLYSVVFVTIFATEIVSNTAAAVAMWTVVLTLAEAATFSPLLLMLGVAMASTSAFMSPVATPATGMAFGGLRGVSLRPMLGVGILVNIVAAVWISLSLHTWIPWFLSR